MSSLPFTVLGAVALATLSSAAVAQTVTNITSTFNVALAVKSKCAITTTPIPDINLGTVDANSGTAQGNATFNVLCTKRTPFSIAMQPSGTPASATGAGTLKGAISGNTDTVAYALFSNAAMTTAWGSTAGTGGNVVTNTGTSDGAAQLPITVYAKVSTVGNVLPDSYRDVVTVTLSY